MNRLKELRKDKNKSQKEIAELLKVNEKNYISLGKRRASNKDR